MSILKYFPSTCIYKAHSINKKMVSYIFMFRDEMIPQQKLILNCFFFISAIHVGEAILQQFLNPNCDCNYVW